MYCFVVVFPLHFKQLQRVVTMALKSLYRVCEIKKLDLIFSFFSVRIQNHSYKNSIVFRLAPHLCSSTSLVYLLASERSQRDTYRGNTIENRGCLFIYWRASEASETLSGVTQSRFRYIYWRASEASQTLSGVTQSRFRYIYYLFICLWGP